MREGRAMDRNVHILTDLDGKKFVLINDIRFKARRREDWKDVFERSSGQSESKCGSGNSRINSDGKKYLYDLLAIKKKRATRLSHKTVR